MTSVQPQESALFSTVYVSSATRPLAPEEILGILDKSREKNQALGITGMLLYKDGNFLQVLEGQEAVLSSLTDRLERDNRHRGMIILSRKILAERQFPEWSMAFQNLDEVDAENLPGYSPFLSASLLDQEFQNKPDLCYRLLLHFKRNIR